MECKILSGIGSEAGWIEGARNAAERPENVQPILNPRPRDPLERQASRRIAQIFLACAATPGL
jgi:hypothetical protein